MGGRSQPERWAPSLRVWQSYCAWCAQQSPCDSQGVQQSYKVGDKGGSLPPSNKGYAIQKNPDNSVTATPMESEMSEGKKRTKKKALR